MVVAHKSSVNEIGVLRKLFEKYAAHDGSIQFEQFESALASGQESIKVDEEVDEEELRLVFKALVSKRNFIKQNLVNVSRCLPLSLLRIGCHRTWMVPAESDTQNLLPPPLRHMVGYRKRVWPKHLIDWIVMTRVSLPLETLEKFWAKTWRMRKL